MAISRACCSLLKLPACAMRRANSPPNCADSFICSCAVSTCCAATARNQARRVSAASTSVCCAAFSVARSICQPSQRERHGKVMSWTRPKLNCRSISRSCPLTKRPRVRLGLNSVRLCARSASCAARSANCACKVGLFSSAMRTAVSASTGACSHCAMRCCASARDCAWDDASCASAGKRPCVCACTSPRSPSGDTAAQPASNNAAHSVVNER